MFKWIATTRVLTQYFNCIPPSLNDPDKTGTTSRRTTSMRLVGASDCCKGNRTFTRFFFHLLICIQDNYASVTSCRRHGTVHRISLKSIHVRFVFRTVHLCGNGSRFSRLPVSQAKRSTSRLGLRLMISVS